MAGLQQSDAVVPQQVFQLPTALAYPLFYKLAQPGATTVSLHAVQSWIMQRNVLQARAPLAACIQMGCKGVIVWVLLAAV